MNDVSYWAVRQIQHIPLDTGSPIVQCSVADPYIVLLTQEGQILMFTLRTESVGLGVRLVLGRPSISQVGIYGQESESYMKL